MSQARALFEMKRFLSNGNPEVLSISGRWGVGKTHAWDETLGAKRSTSPMRRYAYVSAFGIKNLDDLKIAIVQSTVSLDGKALEPTLQSFAEHMSSFEGARKLAGEVTRKSFTFLNRGAAAVPYVGKLSDLMIPGAALLIRNQIICIDDIERAGHGLDVTDILGLVSSFRERKGCKVVLLLNEDGLGNQTKKFRKYLEKVVDQAITFEPTPAESAAAALDLADKMTPHLSGRTIALGITNIRVIRRIRRFLTYVEPALEGLREDVTEVVVASMALLGWCVFEPKLAPSLDHILRYNQFSGLFGEDKRTDQEKKTDLVLREYGFGIFEDVDAILLEGLRAGGFDVPALTAALEVIDDKFAKADVQAAIARPWNILHGSFDDNADEFAGALTEAIEQHGKDITPNDASSALSFLRALGKHGEADRLVEVYVAAQADKPREFFAAKHDHFSRVVDPAIKSAFEKRLSEMPLDRDPAELLLEIGRKHGWNPTEVEFLASVSVDEYHTLVKRLKGDDLQAVITTALQFGDIGGVGDNEREITKRMGEAIRLIAGESPLNAMRVRSYLKDAIAPEPDAAALD